MRVAIVCVLWGIDAVMIAVDVLLVRLCIRIRRDRRGLGGHTGQSKERD